MRAFSKVVDGRNGFSRVIRGTWVTGRGKGTRKAMGQDPYSDSSLEGVCETTTDEKVLAIRVK